MSGALYIGLCLYVHVGLCTIVHTNDSVYVARFEQKKYHSITVNVSVVRSTIPDPLF